MFQTNNPGLGSFTRERNRFIVYSRPEPPVRGKKIDEGYNHQPCALARGDKYNDPEDYQGGHEARK